jgi:hypothetical protein
VDYPEEDDTLEPEEIEAYCVNCKEKTFMLNPQPVWTRRGAPGTRGECEVCGNTVFRMGRTEAHRHLSKPDVGQMLGAQPQPRKGKGGRKPKPRFAAFINYAPADFEIAKRLAEDLSRSGVPAWFDETPEALNQVWASGVHPGLLECSHMVVVLSNAAVHEEAVAEGFEFFKQNRKPVVVAQINAVELPDAIRRSPRFDFAVDYKTAFRAMLQALSS